MFINSDTLKHLIFKIIIFYFYFISFLYPANEKNKVCDTLLNVLSINTNAYKNCLLQKSGDKFSREELNVCKKYYLTEIERLSYVYKNICK